jgi:hypothetical protein
MRTACIAVAVLATCSFDVEKEGSEPGECDDGVDNDSNGVLDCDDPACGCGADADTDTDSDSDVDTDADTDTGTDTDSGTDTGTGTGTGSASAPTCDAQYGDVDGYVACFEDATTCRFNADTARATSCGQLCAERGGECIVSHDNNGPCEDASNDQACDSRAFNTTLCECSRGCGGGPACPAGQTCAGGVCG